MFTLFENYTSDVTFEVINGPYWDFILEKFDFNFYNRNKKIELSDEDKSKLESIEKSIESRLNSINPITGKYYNDKAKRERNINFTIITTEHWYTKFFRNKYESSIYYVVPGLYEGIDIIANNVNEITRLIDVNLVLNGYRVLVRSRLSTFSEIMVFEKLNPKNYNIVLQSQMKGKEYDIVNSKDINRTIKLPPKL